MLLNLSRGRLAAKCHALAALDGLGPERASEVAAAMPGVLLLGAGKLRERWQFLRAAAGARPAGRASRWRVRLAVRGAFLWLDAGQADAWRDPLFAPPH